MNLGIDGARKNRVSPPFTWGVSCKRIFIYTNLLIVDDKKQADKVAQNYDRMVPTPDMKRGAEVGKLRGRRTNKDSVLVITGYEFPETRHNGALN